MKAMQINNEEAQNKWWAFNDARQRSLTNSTHYTEAQKVRAERMKLGLELVYGGKNFYISYGKKAISVKIDHAVVRDRKMLKALESDYEKEGVVKKVSAQGVVYNIPKA